MQVRGGGQQALGYVHCQPGGAVAPLEEMERGGVELYPVHPISPHLHRAARLTSGGRNVRVSLHLKSPKEHS